MKSLIKLKASFEMILSKDSSKIFNINESALKIHDFPKATLLIEFKDLQNPSHICLSSSNSEIALINTSGKIAIYNLITMSKVLIDKKLKSETCNILFTPDDKYLVIGDWNGTIYLFNKATRKYKALAHNKDYMIQSMTCKNDIFYFLTTPIADEISGEVSDAINIVTWRYPFEKNKPEKKTYKIPAGNVIEAKGDYLFLNNDDEIVMINPSKGRVIKRVKFDGRVKYFSLSDDMKYLSVIIDNKVRLYEFKKIKPVREIEMKYGCFINFHCDKYLLLGSWNSGHVYSISDFISTK